MYSQENRDPNICTLDLTLASYATVMNRLKNLQQKNIIGEITVCQTTSKLYRTVRFRINDDVSDLKRKSILNFYRTKYGLTEDEKQLLRDVDKDLTKVKHNVSFYLGKKYHKAQDFERALTKDGSDLYNTRIYIRRGSKYIKNINKKFAKIAELIRHKCYWEKKVDVQNGLVFHTVKPQIKRNAEEARELMNELVKYSANRNNVDAALFEFRSSIPNNKRAKISTNNKKSMHKD
ncbi:MAG: hypothetical protein IJT14_01510 [Rickettsiales bacterium]|nr:hypothetical protein [Rickettsiales bacterium]